VGQKESRARFATSSCDPLHRGGVREDREGFEEALPLLRRHQDAGGDAVARDLNSLAALFDVPQKFEKRVLSLCCGDRAHAIAIIMAVDPRPSQIRPIDFVDASAGAL
jgi:hypothetical protein